jgi:hypothetical protein
MIRFYKDTLAHLFLLPILDERVCVYSFLIKDLMMDRIEQSGMAEQRESLEALLEQELAQIDWPRMANPFIEQLADEAVDTTHRQAVDAFNARFRKKMTNRNDRAHIQEYFEAAANERLIPENWIQDPRRAFVPLKADRSSDVSGALQKWFKKQVPFPTTWDIATTTVMRVREMIRAENLALQYRTAISSVVTFPLSTQTRWIILESDTLATMRKNIGKFNPNRRYPETEGYSDMTIEFCDDIDVNPTGKDAGDNDVTWSKGAYEGLLAYLKKQVAPDKSQAVEDLIETKIPWEVYNKGQHWVQKELDYYTYYLMLKLVEKRLDAEQIKAGFRYPFADSTGSDKLVRLSTINQKRFADLPNPFPALFDTYCQGTPLVSCSARALTLVMPSAGVV